MNELAIGYCTNVHAGDGLEEVRTNLDRYARRVQQLVSPGRPLGIGIWLSNDTVQQLLTHQLAEFREWLTERQLVAYTCNGFPFARFHGEIVKHRVYLPTWWEPNRREYTLNLINAMHQLAAPGAEVSISTLPIAWHDDTVTHESLVAAADELVEVARQLSDLEMNSGRLMYICLEPEPGCVLQTSADVVSFFQNYLLPRENPDLVRRYLRVCHDVCHAFVMFESQSEVLARYAAAGINVGKVQISSAVGVDFEQVAKSDREAARAELGAFVEPHYLHQTVVRDAAADDVFFEDLPLALGDASKSCRGDWRVHFHVPIFLARLGHLRSGQRAIIELLDCLGNMSEPPPHLEVETYAWDVLPANLQAADLAQGIAEEIAWLRQQCQSRSILP